MSDTTSRAAAGVDADVELRLPADGAYASLLRTLAATLAARLDFTMDDIEDLRIAVSEAAAMVLDEADTGTHLTCRFALGDGELDFVISAPATVPRAPDLDGFGWQVLTTLAAEAEVVTEGGAFAVHLTMRSTLPSATGL